MLFIIFYVLITTTVVLFLILLFCYNFYRIIKITFYFHILNFILTLSITFLTPPSQSLSSPSLQTQPFIIYDVFISTYFHLLSPVILILFPLTTFLHDVSYHLMPFAISTFYHLPPILICNSLIKCSELLFRYLRPLFHYLTCFLLFIFIFPIPCSNFIFIWYFILIIHFHILIFIHFLFFFLFLSHSSLISHLTPLFCHIMFLFTTISFHIRKCTLSVSLLMPMNHLLSFLSLL